MKRISIIFLAGLTLAACSTAPSAPISADCAAKAEAAAKEAANKQPLEAQNIWETMPGQDTYRQTNRLRLANEARAATLATCGAPAFEDVR